MGMLRRRPRGMLRSLRLRAILVVVGVALWPLVTFGNGFEASAYLLQMVPIALALSWWLGWRMVRPVESLRDQIFARVDGAADRPIDLHRSDEFGELAYACDELLRRLEERSRANQQFVADVVHELKNPLAAIHAVGESLEGGAVDGARAAHMGRLVQSSTRRLAGLATALLELSRAESGLAGEERASLDLAGLAYGLLDACRQDERWRGCAFDYNGPDQLALSCVPGRLETAVRNLLDNAASFAGPQGHVILSLSQDEDGVRLRVEDDGPGIAEADLPRMFDRFFTTRRSQYGSGLGLALVKAVTEAHGGVVAASSRPGGGACFDLSLPIT